MRQFIKKLALGMLFLQSCTTTEVIGVGLEYGYRRAGEQPKIQMDQAFPKLNVILNGAMNRFITH